MADLSAQSQVTGGYFVSRKPKRSPKGQLRPGHCAAQPGGLVVNW